MRHVINCQPDGTISFIYDDGLVTLLAEAEQQHIRRVSFVEPDASGRWTADLAISGGPVLGPFYLRAEALDAERCWLEREVFGC